MVDSWKFDVSSFMVLLGEGQEFSYRLMRRSIIECMAAAPVAGIQSYLHPHSALLESSSLSYFSPYGCKSAPLRNMRFLNGIREMDVLHDGKLVVYQVSKKRPPRSLAKATLWIILTWHAFGGIMAVLFVAKGTTWIGLTNCLMFLVWSILLRLFDRYCVGPAEMSVSDPDSAEAVFFLGRRNSCLVLEGTREDVARLTGQGLVVKYGRPVEILTAFMRIGSLAVVVFVFLTMPNGSTWDQVAFIGLNMLGQFNVLVGKHLVARDCLGELVLMSEEKVRTRTHVYGWLLRKFGEGCWVDEAQLLPKTDVWKRWRKRVIDDRDVDAKMQYNECLKNGK